MLVAAEVGTASAEQHVRLTLPEQRAAELAVLRVVLRDIKENIMGTHPLHRSALNERLETTRARIRTLASSCYRHSRAARAGKAAPPAASPDAHP